MQIILCNEALEYRKREQEELEAEEWLKEQRSMLENLDVEDWNKYVKKHKSLLNENSILMHYEREKALKLNSMISEIKEEKKAKLDEESRKKQDYCVRHPRPP